MPGRASSVKVLGMTEMGAPISLDGVAVHPDCWCVCLCYLHFASENPEDGEMYFLVPAHLGCPGQSLESCKMVVCVCVCVCCMVVMCQPILKLYLIGFDLMYKGGGWRMSQHCLWLDVLCSGPVPG